MDLDRVWVSYGIVCVDLCLCSNRPFSFSSSVRDDCDFSPCLNGGECLYDSFSFTCRCSVGFAGDRCQTGKCFAVMFVFVIINEWSDVLL